MSNYNFIAYAAMSDEEILIALDAEVFASTFEAEEPDREVRLRRIVTWFTKEEDKLRQAICLNEKVRKAHSAASKDGAGTPRCGGRRIDPNVWRSDRRADIRYDLSSWLGTLLQNHLGCLTLGAMMLKSLLRLAANLNASVGIRMTSA